jgi:phage terminase large subunit-like protein
MPADQLRERLASLSVADLERLAYDWKQWARPEQMAPPGNWTTWLILAGRGFGKTRTGAEQVYAWRREGFKRINLIGPTADDVRDAMIEGESGMLNTGFPHERPRYRSSIRQLEWPDGSISLLFSAEEPDRLRNKQHEKLWCDEVAAWRYDQEAWDQASFGLRLGSHPQIIATTTPRPTKFIKALIADSTTVVTRGTTYANKSNLASGFFSRIVKKYENTRLGRQELNAEVLKDNPGALWQMTLIDATRIPHRREYVRIVVAIDPASTSNPDSDETGIVVAGQVDTTDFDVLEDASGIYTPDGWAKRAVELYQQWEADRIIGEGNNGGEMIETVIRHQNANVSYGMVWATRGKEIRAEPIAALYEQERVHHVGVFSKLEDELTDWDPKAKMPSPNRLDALVWALTELSTESGGGFAGYYAKRKAAIDKKLGRVPK